MARRKSKKAAAARGGKRVKIGARTYKCRAQRVRKGFGRKGHTVKAFCRRVPKK